MATNYTTNYDLCQWEPTDAVQRVEFNADNAKLDAALKALSDQVVQKANQSALNTLVTAVNQKANQTDLTAAVGRISALEGGKADQTSFDQAVSALRSENGLVRLAQAVISSPVSYYSMAVPGWDDAWEVQIRYLIYGSVNGSIHLAVNNGEATFYNLDSQETEPSISIKYGSRDCGIGIISLRTYGGGGKLYCCVDGITTSDSALYMTSQIQEHHFLNNVTKESLSQIQLQVDGCTIQSGTQLALFKVW